MYINYRPLSYPFRNLDFYDTGLITFYRASVRTVISYYNVFLEPTPLKKFITWCKNYRKKGNNNVKPHQS